jgi:hypothetical protein
VHLYYTFTMNYGFAAQDRWEALNQAFGLGGANGEIPPCDSVVLTYPVIRVRGHSEAGSLTGAVAS